MLTKNTAACCLAFQLPPASSYAAVQDVAKVPLEQKGREAYARYLAATPPKAFVVYENGGWRQFSRDGEAMSKALNQCAREGQTCWLYAVDDRVVWTREPAQRIGSAEQLQRK